MIEILKYEPVQKGICVGYVDIKIDKWGLIIRHISHLEKGDKRWFNMPQFSIPGNESKPKYVRYVDFDSYNLNSRFFEALKEAVHAYLEKNQTQKTPSPSEVAELFQGEMYSNKEPLPTPEWEKELF